MTDPASYRPAPGSVPDEPGVYRFRDARGKVIYVGKAKSLRSRLGSYFQDLTALHARTQTMVTTASSVEWTVVSTEVEALQLEYTWIKEYDPRFNVKYRDDKSYPSLAVTLDEEFPRLQVMRGPKRKGVRYYGPYSHAWAIRETLDLLLRVFPARTCSKGVFKRAGQVGRPCLLGYIGKCSAPCVGRVSAEEHRQIVLDFCAFMDGDTASFVRRIERQMREAADSQDYERAARLRDDVGALRKAMEKNAVVLGDATDADVLGLVDDELEAAVQVFHVRGGRIRGQRGFVVEKVEDVDLGDLVEQLLLQLYGGETGEPVPREILVPALPEDAEAVTAWLSVVRGSAVDLRVPQRGDKRALLETVSRNAGQALTMHKMRRAGDLTARGLALAELQEALGLPEAPLRIECFDVSNLQGTEVVASMVVFEDALPRKSEYRRFAVKSVDGQDDVAAIHEVVTRRFRRYLEEASDSPEPDIGDPNADEPFGDERDGSQRARPGHRPRHRTQAAVRLSAQPARRRRRRTPGRSGSASPRGARHRRRVALRAGQAPRGGLAARAGRTGRAAPHQRGALPAAAGARRGAPVRHHLPSPTAVAIDDPQRPRHGAGAGGDPAQGAAPALRLAQAAARGHPRRGRRGARHRSAHGRGRRRCACR